MRLMRLFNALWTNSPLNSPIWSKSSEAKGDLALEDFHLELAITLQVTLPDLDKTTEACNAAQTLLEQRACQRVQHNVDASTVGYLHDSSGAGVVPA